MFGLFRKKRMSYAEDIELAVNSAFQALLGADRLVGIERMFRVSSALGSWAVAIRRVRPDIPVERNGAVMAILSAAESPEHFRIASEAVEHVLAVAKECPRDKYIQAAMLQSFMAPEFHREHIRQLEAESNRAGELYDPLADDPRLR